jgi:hypothetical protein
MRLSIIVLLAAILAIGCAKTQPKMTIVNITMSNNSSNALDWVKLDWAGPDVGGGIMSPGVWKTSVSVEWPAVSTAKITFVDDKTRKPYSLEVSFASINERVRTGRCHHVTIRILDYDKADVICEEQAP